MNLESSATVSESVPVDTLITSFTCVDAATEVDASVDTVNPSNAPSTGFFFVQTESGSGTEKGLLYNQLNCREVVPVILLLINTIQNNLSTVFQFLLSFIS